MYFRIKSSGQRRYLQIVESVWDGSRARQRVVASLGRVDGGEATERLAQIIASGNRLVERIQADAASCET